MCGRVLGGVLGDKSTEGLGVEGLTKATCVVDRRLAVILSTNAEPPCSPYLNDFLTSSALVYTRTNTLT